MHFFPLFPTLEISSYIEYHTISITAYIANKNEYIISLIIDSYYTGNHSFNLKGSTTIQSTLKKHTQNIKIKFILTGIFITL